MPLLIWQHTDPEGRHNVMRNMGRHPGQEAGVLEGALVPWSFQRKMMAGSAPHCSGPQPTSTGGEEGSDLKSL